MYFQAKQIQIDDLLSKLNHSSDDLERLREEKDDEIAILQEGMDSTIMQLSDAQQVLPFRKLLMMQFNRSNRHKELRMKPQTPKSTISSLTTARNSTRSSVGS